MIQFGTDGWRAIIADDFTFENLRYVALATARYAKKQATRNRPSAVIGYDTRFLSKEFAREVARVMVHEGINVHLTFHMSSTPQVSFATKQKRATVGIIITASHNPPIYNGFKVKATFGGPAAPEQIAAIEEELRKILKNPPRQWKLLDFDTLVSKRKISLFSARESYWRHIRRKIDLDLITAQRLKIAYDPMYGAGIQLLEPLIPKAITIHNEWNPGFGSLHAPEPIESNLRELIQLVQQEHCDIGIATDGDADRLGVVDSDGHYVTPHQVFMLLLKYLYESRKKRGIVVKTVSLTSMVDLYCKKRNIRLVETPVGFKHIAKLMTQERVLIGGEESGGFATTLHIPERDGLFAGLLLLEMLARKKTPLKELCRNLDEEFGPHRFLRRDVRVSAADKEAILQAFAKQPKKIGKFHTSHVSTLDGYKFFFEEGGWLLIRASGTEPLIRFYAEADSLGKAHEMIEAALRLAK